MWKNFLTAISICGYSLKSPLSSLWPHIMFSSLTCKINSPLTAPESYPIIASARIHFLNRYRSRRLGFLGITPYIQLLYYKALNLNSSQSRLSGQWTPGICLCLPSTKALPPGLVFWCMFWGSNSSFAACKASIFLTEPSSQLLFVLFCSWRQGLAKLLWLDWNSWQFMKSLLPKCWITACITRLAPFLVCTLPSKSSWL